jgi:hypothetical protein
LLLREGDFQINYYSPVPYSLTLVKIICVLFGGGGGGGGRWKRLIQNGFSLVVRQLPGYWLDDRGIGALLLA